MCINDHSGIHNVNIPLLVNMNAQKLHFSEDIHTHTIKREKERDRDGGIKKRTNQTFT